MDHMARAKVFVSTSIVRANKEHGRNEPAIIVERDGARTTTNQVDILDQNNEVVASVIQTDNPNEHPYIYIEAGPIKIHKP